MKIIKLLVIYLFLLQIFLHSIILIVSKKETISVSEKRDLATFPNFNIETYIKGDFNRGISAYVNDHFAFRDNYIKLSSNINKSFYIKTDKLADMLKPIKDTEIENIKKREDELSQEMILEFKRNRILKKEDDDMLEFFKQQIEPVLVTHDIYILNDDRIAERYIFSEKNTDKFTQVINELYKETGKPECYVIVPFTPYYYYLQEKYINYTNDQYKALEYLNQNLDGPKIIDVHEQLKKHLDEKIYFRMDHHWTSLGAYYAYVAFLNDIGEDAKHIDSYEKRRLENFKGSLYKTVLQTPYVSKFQEMYDYVDMYLPQNKSVVSVFRDEKLTKLKDKRNIIISNYNKDEHLYNAFMGGDTPITYIHSDINNGKSILVLKDSYGNSFVPYLVDNFEHIYTVDARFFNTDEHEKFKLGRFFKDNKIDKLLFINYGITVTGEYWMNFGDIYEKLSEAYTLK